jgi:DNA repair exonuclease SbcCD nuclease subunit
MIYLTGDTHIPIDISKLNTTNFPEQKEMTKDDYVIVLGDFGLIWKNEQDNEEKYWTKWLNDKPFTTFFLDGNHENHNRLNSYPVSKLCGGSVHKISDSIFHLMRNNMFTIEGKNFYVVGGARSTDKAYRKENVSWWSSELPTNKECLEIVDFVDANGYKVDYVLTHCFPSFYQRLLADWFERDDLTNVFDIVDEKTPNKICWYCGHYHLDKQVDEKHIVLYNDIIRLK